MAGMTDDQGREATEAGKLKYPPDGIYDGWRVCTRKDTCPYNCKGECGCEACHAAYCDFLSWE